MKALLLAAMLLAVSGCSLETIHTQHYEIDADGNTYERHYLVLPYQSRCDGTCKAAHKDLKSYNMKTHQLEGGH